MYADLDRIKQRFNNMQGERTTWESHWQELVDYLMPYRQDIYVPGTSGAKKMSKVVNSTGLLAHKLFAAGVSSKMANPAMPWFQLEVNDEALQENRECRLWLDRLKEIFYNVFNQSNFYSADQEANLDVSGFGTNVIFVGAHHRWGPYYQTLNLAEVYLAADRYGQIDTLYRRFSPTARQLVQMFGEKTVSDRVRELAKKNQDTTVTVLHVVEPRTDRKLNRLDALNMEWASVYLEYDQNHVLEEGGYREFPYAVGRYDVMPGELYGRGPGIMALPDLKELQVRESDTTKARQLAMSPPVLLPSDGFAGLPIRRTPGGITFIRSDGSMSDKIGVFPTSSSLASHEQSNERMEARIGRIFFSDLMIMASDKEQTLGEFLHVAQEKMQLLGPFLGRLQTERYNPIFERTFSVLWEQGKIPQPPRELIGEDGYLKYKVDYISPLARAQKLSESQGIIQATGFLAQASAVKQDLPDVLDWEGAARLVLQNQGVPQRLIRPQDDVDLMRQERAQQIQEQQMAAMAMEASKTMPALNQGPEPGSVIDELNQAMREGSGNA